MSGAVAGDGAARLESYRAPSAPGLEGGGPRTARLVAGGAQPLSHGARTALVLLVCWLLITSLWWTLALWPVTDPPPWLAAARSVCFGTTASGLPDTYGWIVLAAAPGTMLVAILVAWGGEVAAGLASLWARATGRAVLVALAVAVALGLGAAASRISAGLAIENVSFDALPAGALPENYPRLSGPVPPLALVDQDGRAFTNENLRGTGPTLVTFAFAHCTTICPAIVQTLRSLATRLGEEAPAIAVITLDPWRDTPSRLASMHGDWVLPPSARVLSGEVDAVVAALDGFNVPWQRDENTGDVAHPALVYAIDAEGRIAYAFNNPTVDWLAEAVRRLEVRD